MTRQRLYVVYGKGTDSVGLVGSITAPISQAGGNIVDLRQDVLHGLFTIFLVVDLSENKVRIEDLTEMVQRINEDTGLELSVDNYNPKPRDPDKKEACDRYLKVAPRGEYVDEVKRILKRAR